MLLPLSCCTTRGKNPGVAGELPAEHDGSITVIAHSELGKAYSEDLRERVFATATAPEVGEIATILRVKHVV